MFYIVDLGTYIPDVRCDGKSIKFTAPDNFEAWLFCLDEAKSQGLSVIQMYKIIAGEIYAAGAFGHWSM